MTAELFHQAFDQLADPVLLQEGEKWHLNPAAQYLSLSEQALEQLATWGNDAFIWLSLRFYRVSVQQMDGAPLLFLHQDAFLAEAAANVSSQVRQRLQVAFGCTADLSRVEGIRSDLQARERLSGLNRELYQLLRMAQELELSGQSSAAMCRTSYFNLSAALVACADEVKELLVPLGATLKLEIEPDELMVKADPDKINYLVLSLISNSLAHLPQTGGQMTLSLKEQKKQAILTISDNGSGFSPDLLSHPLWSEPDRLAVGRGLGLGLPLIQRIAAAHEGTVMVFPSAKGSRVTVSFPTRTPDFLFASPGAPARTVGGFSMAKVLLSNALPNSLYFPDPDGDE